MASKHGWNAQRNYLEVVRQVLDNHPFVIDDNLTIDPPSADAGRISGAMFCYENVVLSVLKHYEIRTQANRLEARTARYSYHARVKGGGDVLRYDNQAHWDHPTHHHKHDYRDGKNEVTHVGRNWPQLSEVLDELQAMFWGEG